MKRPSRRNVPERVDAAPSAECSRRALLVGSSVVALLTAAAYATYNVLQPREQEQGEEAFDTFPSRVKGMQSVQKYPAVGAKRCIVHIRQYHESAQDPSGAFADCTPEERKLFMDAFNDYVQKMLHMTQEDIFGGIDDLRRQGFLADVHSEGLFDHHAKEIDEIAKVRTKLQANREKLLRSGRADLVQKVEYLLKDSLHNSGLRSLEKFLIERDIPVLAAEDDSMKEAFADDAAKELVLDGREKALVKRLSERVLTGNRCACVVYGGAHDLVDDVQRWNEEHPENPSSLIVLTPTNHEKITKVHDFISAQFEEMKRKLATKEATSASMHVPTFFAKIFREAAKMLDE